jgi:hypothetical protein
MRKLLRGVLIFVAGVCVGVMATLGVQWYLDFGERIKRQVVASVRGQVVANIQRHVDSATDALKAPLDELDLFIAKNHRPPTDIEELAAFAKDDPGFDRSKFSELRLEFPSDEAVAIVWQFAPPLHGAGTNTLLNWRRDLDEPPN